MIRKTSLMATALWLAGSAAVAAYDVSWYRVTGWAGEYPGGFTMAEDASVRIRAAPDPDAAAGTECLLRQNATYHQWNTPRIEADRLEFVSFAPIVDYELTAGLTMTLGRETDGGDEDVTFAPGARWSYLTYVAEGSFLMRYGDTIYFAGQDLIEQSRPADPAQAERGEPDEWLKLTCANGAVGWLLLRDVRDLPAFGSPNITGYGDAADAGPVARK